MVRSDGLVKVLDFGLARLVEADQFSRSCTDDQTAEGTLLGTLKYMSPEQALGKPVTSASDLFSLGIVLYELVTGRHPFPGNHMAAILHSIVEVDPIPAMNIYPAIDPSLAALVTRLLDKQPEARPSAVEVIALLGDAAALGDESLVLRADVATIRPQIVGRELEWRALERACHDAERGRGSALFVSGEPGIGKTTLLEAFVNHVARRKDVLALHGRCSHRLSASDAYLPWMDAMGRCLDGPDGNLLEGTLRSVAPAWHALTASSTDALGRVSAESGQLSSGRLKREFRSLLVALTQQRTVLLFLDDLHQCDESTVDLLNHLGQDLPRIRLLLLGAYRPTESTSVNHPFEQFRRELVTRDLGRDLALPFLSRDGIDRFLEREFPAHRFPDTFSEFLHERTEGSPLFLLGLIRYLKDREVIVRNENGWTVARIPLEFDHELPDSIASLMDTTLHRLAADDRQLLQAASVQGIAFHAAVIADAVRRDRADVEERLQEIGHLHGVISPGVEFEFDDGTLTLQYRFIHVLFQETLFDSITPARRSDWSLRMARLLTELHAHRSRQHALDLAFLYETGREFRLAAEWLQKAAQLDIQIGANREAAATCQRGVRLLTKVTPSTDRDRIELGLQFTCGFAESLARGYGSSESLQAYQRAEELCFLLSGVEAQLSAEQFSIMHGLWAYHLAKMDATALLSLGSRIVGFAENFASRPYIYAAHASFALALVELGDLQLAEHHLAAAQSSGSYTVDDDRRFIGQMCMPFGPLFHCVRSWLFQLQGRTDDASAEAHQAVEWGNSLGTPQFQVHSWYALLHYLRRDAAGTLAWATKMVEFARRVDLESYVRNGIIMQAWASVELAGGGGHHELELLELARSVVPAQRALGIRSGIPLQLCLLGEALTKIGRHDEAQDALSDSLISGRESGERWWEAETLRQIGLLEEQVFGMTDQAIARFREACALAKMQGAKLLMDRCQSDLKRLEPGSPSV